MIMHQISVIARSCHVFTNRRLSKYDINNTEQAILMLLQTNSNINQDVIVKYFHMDKGTIAKALSKLEKKELIKRIINSENQREKIISLTEKGIESMGCMKQVLNEWYDCIFDGLSQDEIDSLEKITKKLALNASKALDLEEINEKK